jgi:hypothetical protein
MRIPVFYPNIAPPKQWILQMILYGEKFASITPDIQMAYDRLEMELGYNEVNDLLTSEVYEPITTNQVHLDNNFDDRIKRLVRSQDRYFQRSNESSYHRTLTPRRDTYFIHESKMSDRIINALRLAGYGNLDIPEWITVNESFGYKYMSLLADHYAQYCNNNIDDNIIYIPTSVDHNYYRFLSRDYGKATRRCAIRFDILRRLPVPTEDVNIKRLVDFRRNNVKSLERLNSLLERKIDRILLESENYQDFTYSLDRYTKEILIELDRLNDSLNSAKINTIFSSFSHFFTGSEATKQILDIMGIHDKVELPMIGGAVTTIFGGYNNLVQYRNLRRNSDVEYLYLGRKRNILPY